MYPLLRERSMEWKHIVMYTTVQMNEECHVESSVRPVLGAPERHVRR